MGKPWRKNREWPFRTTAGEARYRLGFRDHNGVGRSKSFRTVSGAGGANEWTRLYIQAERRGPQSLEQFLEQRRDAGSAQSESNVVLLQQVVADFLAAKASWNEEGLARATFSSYRGLTQTHLLGHERQSRQGRKLPPAPWSKEAAITPISEFQDPTIVTAWMEKMVAGGVPKQTRVRAWKVLSSILSWAATSTDYPDITRNGCLLAASSGAEKRGTRSSRRKGTGDAPAPGMRPQQSRRTGSAVRSWALTPITVELVARQLTRRADSQRPDLMPHRDKMIAFLQYGLCLRDQEVYGLRWECFDSETVSINEALSANVLDIGKTAGSQRITACPSLLREDLAVWREALISAGHSAGPHDFVIPGDLGGEDHGIYDEYSGGRHFSSNQAKKWHPKFFKPAVDAVAGLGGDDHQFADIAGATPYALRRGGISLRLRTEPAVAVAEEAGTSLEMLSRHYGFHLRDLGSEIRSFDAEWRLARESAPGVLASLRRERSADAAVA
jgi:integrase